MGSAEELIFSPCYHIFSKCPSNHRTLRQGIFCTKISTTSFNIDSIIGMIPECLPSIFTRPSSACNQGEFWCDLETCCDEHPEVVRTHDTIYREGGIIPIYLSTNLGSWSELGMHSPKTEIELWSPTVCGMGIPCLIRRHSLTIH